MESMPQTENIYYERTDEPVIFQGTALGNVFRRVAVVLPDGEKYFQPRRVKIALVFDAGSGDLRPSAYTVGEHPPLDDFPIIPLVETGPLREQMIGRDIWTVRKHGASRQWLDVDPNRGIPGLIIVKPESSFFTYFGPPNKEHPQIDKNRLPF